MSKKEEVEDTKNATEGGEKKVEKKVEKKDAVQAQDRAAVVNKIIRNHAIGSTGIGFIPLPVVDLVALTGTQINMLRRLAATYEVPFMKDKVKNLVGSLIGGAAPGAFAGGMASMVKAIPFVGQIGGMLTMPALAGATTYAVGKVFVQHFESGGTFLNFKPEEVKEYYEKMFEEGKKMTA